MAICMSKDFQHLVVMGVGGGAREECGYPAVGWLGQQWNVTQPLRIIFLKFNLGGGIGYPIKFKRAGYKIWYNLISEKWKWPQIKGGQTKAKTLTVDILVWYRWQFKKIEKNLLKHSIMILYYFHSQEKKLDFETFSWILLNLRYELTLTRNLYEKQVLLFYIRGNLKLFSFTDLLKKKNHPKDCEKLTCLHECHNAG